MGLIGVISELDLVCGVERGVVDDAIDTTGYFGCTVGDVIHVSVGNRDYHADDFRTGASSLNSQMNGYMVAVWAGYCM